MAEYLRKLSVVNKLIALENELQQYKPFRPCEATMYRRICDVEIEIGKMDAEDVASVQHGKWIPRVDTDTPMHECSVCGARVVKGFYEYDNPNKYCYHCGAKMDLEV